MARAFRIIVTALRVLVMATCSLVLVVSLVLWPRSRFYVDQVEMAVDDKPPWELSSTAYQDVLYRANAINIVSGFGTLGRTGPGEMTIHESPLTRPLSFSSQRGPSQTHWVPAIGRLQWGYPSVDGSLDLTAPYWLKNVIALAGLAVAMPNTALSLFSGRVGIRSLLFVTFAVALLISLHKAKVDGGIVLGGEAIVLFLFAWRAWMEGARSEGWTQRGAYVVAILCLLGVAMVAAFTIYINYVASWSPSAYPAF